MTASVKASPASDSRAGAGVAAQGKCPEAAREEKNDRRSYNELEHKRSGLAERLNQESRGNVGDDDDWNDPAEDDFEEPRENRVWITRDVEEVEIAINEPLRAHDPETD